MKCETRITQSGKSDTQSTEKVRESNRQLRIDAPFGYDEVHTFTKSAGCLFGKYKIEKTDATPVYGFFVRYYRSNDSVPLETTGHTGPRYGTFWFIHWGNRMKCTSKNRKMVLVLVRPRYPPSSSSGLTVFLPCRQTRQISLRVPYGRHSVRFLLLVQYCISVQYSSDGTATLASPLHQVPYGSTFSSTVQNLQSLQ